jgi:hypothetical protein
MYLPKEKALGVRVLAFDPGQRPLIASAVGFKSLP